MTKIYDVRMNCFISAAFFIQSHYVVISLVVYCTDQAMKVQTRIQLTKSYCVTVVFLAN